MEITGVLIKKFPIMTTVSKAGKELTYRHIIIDIDNQYHDRIYITVPYYGFKYLNEINEGDYILVKVNIQSFESTSQPGQYHTNIRAYCIMSAQSLTQV